MKKLRLSTNKRSLKKLLNALLGLRVLKEKKRSLLGTKRLKKLVGLGNGNTGTKDKNGLIMISAKVTFPIMANTLTLFKLLNLAGN